MQDQIVETPEIVDLDGEGREAAAYRIPNGQSCTFFLAAVNNRAQNWKRELRILLEPHADVEIIGLIVGRGTQQLQQRITITHSDHSKSRMRLFATLENAACAEIRGRIIIPKSAFGSEAMLEERVLVLSPDARITAVPDLEILEPDVRASHSASIGRVNDDQLFYLQARGYSKRESRQLIVEGFLEQHIARFPEATQSRLREALISTT